MIWNMYSQNMNANNQKINKKKKRNFIFRGVSILSTIVFLVSGLCGCTADDNREEKSSKRPEEASGRDNYFPAVRFCTADSGR